MTENEIHGVLVEEYKQVLCDNTDLSKRRLAYLCDIEKENSLMTLLSMFDEVEKYRLIGTVEECQKGVERQKMKKPEIKIHRYSSSMHCPNCKFRMVSKIDGELIAGSQVKYCHNCGQSIDWSK